MSEKISRGRVGAVLLAALIAISTLGVGFAGSAAAVDVSETSELSSNYSDVDVRVADVPESGFNGGTVVVDTSQSTITESNVTIVAENNAGYSDVNGDSNIVEIHPSYADVLASAGSLTFDIKVDGSVEKTVSVDTVATDAAESDVISASNLETAATINVTVDKSEIDAANQTLTRNTTNGTAVGLAFAEEDSSRYAPAAAAIEFASFTNGTQEVDITTRSESAQRYVIDALTNNGVSGDGRIYASDAVEQIEVDGTVIYESSDGGGGGFGGGDTPLLAVAAAAVAGVFIVTRL